MECAIWVSRIGANRHAGTFHLLASRVSGKRAGTWLTPFSTPEARELSGFLL
jgi:hypothetical protein